MVGLKRTRPRQDIEDVEVETASSHLRHNHKGRKRSRLTPVNGMSDDDDDDASIVSSIRNAHAMQEDELESDDEEVMAQAARLHANGDEIVNRAADFGIIEEVHCKNFMCHANLTMKLGPLINFIIGHNGSGKSAVLTALQLCLGGKATSTNRGQSLKHFIKTGCEQCTLSVKIKNQGELAYEPRKYGDSIIVERVFTRNGTSNFKLKSADGKLQANKKGDLDEMLDALGLMMDNPMNVLTQDMARQFLNSSNAVEKYKFFYQGTQLEQLDNDYRILEESLQQNQEQEHNLKASAQAAKQHYEAAEKKAQMAERAATLQEQYNGLSRQMAWIQVQEQEETLAHMEGDIRRQEGVIEDRKAKFAEMDASKEEYARARDEAKEALDSLNADVAAKAGERDSIKEDFESTKTKLMESIAQQRSIKSEIESAQKTVERLQTSIEQEREKIASADNGRHAQKLDEIQAAEDQLASMREDEQQKSSESRVFDVAVRDAKAKLDDAHKAKDKGEAAVKGSENRIAAFERERGDWRQAYSPRLPALLKAIEQDGRFKEKPVGPLGRYVKLLQPKWADILEQSSGGALNAFAVTTKGDQVILSDLMRRSNYNGQIYVTTSRPFDTSQNEPPEQYDTWMRVLRIESSIVRNCLIINQSIDKTLLEEDPEKAKDMISRRIPNVQQIFSKNPVLGDGRTRWGYRFALTSGGGEAAAPIQPWKGGARMQTDTESQIAAERETLSSLKSELHRLELSHRESQNQVTKANQALVRHKRDIKDLTIGIQRQEVAVQDLKNELEADTPQENALEHLESELKDAQDTLEMNQNQYGAAVVEKDRLNAEQRPIKHKLNEVQKEIEEIEEHISKAQIRLDRAESTRAHKVLETNRSYEAIGDAEKRMDELKQLHADQLGTVESFTEQAESVCLRVPVDPGETTDSLEAKLGRLQREQARQREQLGGDKETLILKKLEAKAHYDECQRAHDNHDIVLITLKKALANRKARWLRFRDLIVARAQGHFGYLLSNRKFRGDLEIDHSQRTLEIKVQPDAATKSSKGRQTKTLSGGEKSFSTICLLLALWEAMGSPVRCLDEFDVFMDQVNRDISMRMMIEAARRSVSRQFVLITPQSMNNVQIKDDVKIHKMNDPERGQTTLTQFVAA